VSEQLIILSAIVLLPIIPAYLLFKLLPSKADVTGPFHGQKVALSGAFAGYVVLLIFISTYYAKNLHGPTYRKWTVHGRVRFPVGERPALRGDLGAPLVRPDEANGFSFEIPVAEGQDVPNLVLHAAGYSPLSIPLFDEPAPGEPEFLKKVDEKRGTIRFIQPIVFERPADAPPYQPNVAAVQPNGATVQANVAAVQPNQPQPAVTGGS
jgi:hypothetical protein